jgi:CRISPR-associated exonuclease Cas4
MPVVSYQLGLRGLADVVEFHRCENYKEGYSCSLPGQKGWWYPAPIEYKRGRPKPDERDAVQLCAQAIALEEMMNINVNFGFIFYGQTKHRLEVAIDNALRNRTIALSNRMYKLFQQENTPPAPVGRRCSHCSLIELCQPEWMLRHRSVKDYLATMLRQEETTS